MKLIELNTAVLQILDDEIGYEVNKIYADKQKFIERQNAEINKQLSKKGVVDASLWTTHNFENLYNAFVEYRKLGILPKENLITLASRFVMKNTKITNPQVARQYVLDVHNAFIERTQMKLEELKQSGEAVASKTGYCQFEERLKEEKNKCVVANAQM